MSTADWTVVIMSLGIVCPLLTWYLVASILCAACVREVPEESEDNPCVARTRTP